MGEETRGRRVHERWAHLRFSVIGQLLAAPPDKGELKAAIEGLAARAWRHPTRGRLRIRVKSGHKAGSKASGWGSSGPGKSLMSSTY
jgi:hypothetical protein